VVRDRCARGAAPVRARGRCAPSVRAAPASLCACCRVRAGGRAFAGHSEAARAFVCVHDERQFAGHRYRGDHRDDPRASRSADARQRRSRALNASPTGERERPGGAPAHGPARAARLLPRLAAAQEARSEVAGPAQMQQRRREWCNSIQAGGCGLRQRNAGFVPTGKSGEAPSAILRLPQSMEAPLGRSPVGDNRLWSGAVSPAWPRRILRCSEWPFGSSPQPYTIGPRA